MWMANESLLQADPGLEVPVVVNGWKSIHMPGFLWGQVPVTVPWIGPFPLGKTSAWYHILALGQASLNWPFHGFRKPTPEKGSILEHRMPGLWALHWNPYPPYLRSQDELQVIHKKQKFHIFIQDKFMPIACLTHTGLTLPCFTAPWSTPTRWNIGLFCTSSPFLELQTSAPFWK